MACVFCQIVAGELPADKVWEDDDILAFRDLHPAAPTHVLVIPKTHHASLSETVAADPTLAGKVITACTHVARQLELPESGYRVVVNEGAQGGQTVFHLHAHVLGGRALSWPPG